MSVVIETTVGDLTVDLFTEERPVACLNFLKLCKLKYYNFNLFHTVEQGFIAQTGDPSGAGDGGSSVWGVVESTNKRFFEAESMPKIYHTNAGLLSLVSAGKHLVGSQFFFTLGANLTSLDGVHCVIGEVVEGHETLRKLNESIVDDSFRPYQDIRITHTVILDDPFPDPRGFQVPSRSPSPTPERLQNGRIAADEDIDDTDGKSMAEIHEMLAAREAKARATILEIVGDLPDAEMAPPENVLFVCKLNPVTTDDDLEIIFSRFGKVKTCEVIRDKKSGDSLQYAFVEFEDKKSCEAAYFKMDNVLIDDRRIHVDFSQSVAKVKWRGKGRGVEGPDGRIDFNDLRGSSKKGHERNNGEGNGRAQKERDRMTSEERRQARAERHRAQQEREQTRRARSRERAPPRERPHHENRRDFEQREARHQDRRAKSPIRNSRFVEEQQRRRNSRSRSKERGSKVAPMRRYSTERQRVEKRSPDRRRQRDNSMEKHNRNRNDRSRRDPTLENDKANVQKDKLKRKIDTKKKKSKKSKLASSSEDSSTSDEESESETESSSESETSSSSDSSSEDERKKKKKSKKSKKNKHKSQKRKKKHRK